MTERIDCISVRLTASIPIVVVIIVVKVVGLVVVSVGLILQVELDRIKPDDDEPRSALVAHDIVTLLGLGINEDFFGTFGTDRCRHLCRYS